MREDLLLELENEYAQQRTENERVENSRREKIRTEQPAVYALIQEREQLVFGTLKNILNGSAEAGGLPEKMEELSTRIRTCLAENGFPPDYLSPVYRCPVCRDTGKTGETVREPCECLKKAYQAKLRQKIGLKSDGAETFGTFNLMLFSNEKKPGEYFSQRQQMQVFRDDCEKWSEQYPNNRYRDVLLSGKSGLGKTFLLHAMAERLIERNVNVLIISAYRMLEILRKSYFANEEEASELLDTEVLMIDDLGSEPLMQNITVEQLFNLINERQNRSLSTVISTNLNLVEFQERYTERIASRLTDRRNCMVLSLTGNDIRKGGGPQA